MSTKAEDAIALYQSAKSEFERQTKKTQEALDAYGWYWVCIDVSGYRDDHYQHWLVSPEMYGSLELWHSPDRVPEMLDAPPSKWVENTDYILF